MKHCTMLLAALLASSAAFAADLPVPALRRAAIVSPPSNSGCYLGGVLGGTINKQDVQVSEVASAVFNGGSGMLGLDIGCQYWSGPWFFAVEGIGLYDLTQGSVAFGGTPSNKLLGMALFKVGAGLGGLFGAPAAPATAGQSPVPIAVPSGLTNLTAAPYLATGGVFRPFANGWGYGGGLDVVIAQNWNLDIKYIRAQYNVTPVTGVSLRDENFGLIGLNYKW